MSVFKVHVNTNQQGYLDYNPATASPGFLGNQMQPSKQRTMFCAGPNRIYRELFDGQVFTDCNYWKRFDIAVHPDTGFIEVLVDDGSVFSDVPGENTFPKVFAVTVLNTDTYATNFIDFVGTYGGPAQFVQITNPTGGNAATIELNGDVSAIMTLTSNATQIFNAGDLSVTKLGFQSAAGTTLQVIASLSVQCNS